MSLMDCVYYWLVNLQISFLALSMLCSFCQLQFPRLSALVLVRLSWGTPAGSWREGRKEMTGYFSPDFFASGDISVVSALN